MTKPRTPPVWLVLLPALALAAVGVRAVTAEMRASEDAARERARSVASRLARSVDALVEEYAGPLPAAGSELSRDAADEAVAHLEPHGAFLVGEWSAQGHAPKMQPARSHFALRSEDSASFVLAADALARAEKLAAEGRDGHVAAAALLAATASAVGEGRHCWGLRYAQARHEAAAGERQQALESLGSAWDERDENLFEFDNVRYPEASLVLAAEILGKRDPPAWMIAAYDRCARMPWIADDAALDRVDELLGDAIPQRLREQRRLGIRAREMAHTRRGTTISTAALEIDGESLDLTLWRSARVSYMPKLAGEIDALPRALLSYWSLLGGEIPRSVVDERLLREARALATESGVLSVVIRAPDGRRTFGVTDITGHRDLIVESIPLAEPLSDWRAEAVVAPESGVSGVPTSAWLLAAALAVTTTALVAGMLALRRAAERSARLAEDRQTFLDHVAHELRTPAAAVQALTEELASGHVTKEKEPQYREHLLRKSRRLSALVEDTLDLTRLDAGRLAFKMEPADLRDVVRRAIEESSGAGRVVATLPDAPVVRAVDEGTLRRAVKNLVENAVRHGGGDAPVTVALEASDGHASIVVADNGRGIAAEHLPRLFERFYRVPSATHEVKGVGLGLALCREVARAHGGDVTVESRVGKGSTFTLRMPLA